MTLDLRLHPIRESRIGLHIVQAGLEKLSELKVDMSSLSSGRESQNRLEQLIVNLKKRKDGESFDEVTDVVGRERLILHLYLGKTDKDIWLPEFTKEIAVSVLGCDGKKWPAQRRWLAVQLFFTQFTNLPACAYLADRLQEAYGSDSICNTEADKTWHNNSAILFKIDAPRLVAASAKDDETTSEVHKRLGLAAIPSTSVFLKRLNEELLLSKLEGIPLGGGTEILKEFLTFVDPKQNIRRKDLEYEGGVCMGAAALRILTKRSLKAGGDWKRDWADWILKLGCDPSLPQSSSEFNRWWGCWQPTRDELLCAQRALNKKTLNFFLEFLEKSLRGTPDYHMYERREWFLRRLQETQKIIRFRLILNETCFYLLPKEFQNQKHRVCRHDGSATGACVIAMECVDDVWMFEGTHNYAIRAFLKRAPSNSFFEYASMKYSALNDGEMHHSCVSKTGIYKKHQGDWIHGNTGILRLLRALFRVEWRI